MADQYPYGHWKILVDMTISAAYVARGSTKARGLMYRNHVPDGGLHRRAGQLSQCRGEAKPTFFVGATMVGARSQGVGPLA